MASKLLPLIGVASAISIKSSISEPNREADRITGLVESRLSEYQAIHSKNPHCFIHPDSLDIENGPITSRDCSSASGLVMKRNHAPYFSPAYHKVSKDDFSAGFAADDEFEWQLAVKTLELCLNSKGKPGRVLASMGVDATPDGVKGMSVLHSKKMHKIENWGVCFSSMPLRRLVVKLFHGKTTNGEKYVWKGSQKALMKVVDNKQDASNQRAANGFFDDEEEEEDRLSTRLRDAPERVDVSATGERSAVNGQGKSVPAPHSFVVNGAEQIILLDAAPHAAGGSLSAPASTSGETTVRKAGKVLGQHTVLEKSSADRMMKATTETSIPVEDQDMSVRVLQGLDLITQKPAIVAAVCEDKVRKAKCSGGSSNDTHTDTDAMVKRRDEFAASCRAAIELAHQMVSAQPPSFVESEMAAASLMESVAALKDSSDKLKELEGARDPAKKPLNGKLARKAEPAAKGVQLDSLSQQTMTNVARLPDGSKAVIAKYIVESLREANVEDAKEEGCEFVMFFDNLRGVVTSLERVVNLRNFELLASKATTTADNEEAAGVAPENPSKLSVHLAVTTSTIIPSKKLGGEDVIEDDFTLEQLARIQDALCPFENCEQENSVCRLGAKWLARVNAGSVLEREAFNEFAEFLTTNSETDSAANMQSSIKYLRDFYSPVSSASFLETSSIRKRRTLSPTEEARKEHQARMKKEALGPKKAAIKAKFQEELSQKQQHNDEKDGSYEITSEEEDDDTMYPPALSMLFSGQELSKISRNVATTLTTASIPDACEPGKYSGEVAETVAWVGSLARVKALVFEAQALAVDRFASREGNPVEEGQQSASNEEAEKTIVPLNETQAEVEVPEEQIRNEEEPQSAEQEDKKEEKKEDDENSGKKKAITEASPLFQQLQSEEPAAPQDAAAAAEPSSVKLDLSDDFAPPLFEVAEPATLAQPARSEPVHGIAPVESAASTATPSVIGSSEVKRPIDQGPTTITTTAGSTPVAITINVVVDPAVALKTKKHSMTV